MSFGLRLLAAMLLATALPLQAALVPRLVGHWLGAYRGQPIELILNADGSGRYRERDIRWNVQYGQLHLDHEGEVEIFAMKADSETLVMAGGEMATLLVLVRVSEPLPENTEADSVEPGDALRAE